MADQKISALTALTTVDSANDELVIVDKSDTTQAASGTTKRAIPANVIKTPTDYITLNENDSPPTPAADDHAFLIDSNGIPYTVDENDVRDNILTGSGWTPAGGYKFDGTDDLINVPDNANHDVGTGDFAIEMLFSPDGVSGTQYLCNKEDSGVGYGLYMTDDDLYIRLDDGTTDVSAIIGTAVFEADNVYHVFVSFDRSGNATAYVNTKSVGTVDISTASLTLSSAGALRVGSTTAGGSYFAGIMWMPRLFNRTYTQAEVIELYNNGEPHKYRLPYADIGASQTAIITGNATENLSNFDTFSSASTTGFEGVNTAATGELRISFAMSGDLPFGGKYRLKMNVSTFDNISSAGNIYIRPNPTTGAPIEYIDLQISAGEHDIIFEIDDVTTDGSPHLVIPLEMTATSHIVVEDISLTKVGCVLELLPENMGRLGAIETMNGSHSSTSGSPISLSAEQRPLIYRDVKLSIANTATTLTDIVPPGYMIESIRAKASASVTAVKIGTSSGGQEVVASSTAGTTPTILTLAATAHDGYSESASDTLYAEHATAGETLDLIFTFRRAG